MQIEIIHTQKEGSIQAVILIKKNQGTDNIDADICVIFKSKNSEFICLPSPGQNIQYSSYNTSESKGVIRLEKGIYMAQCPASQEPEMIEVIAESDSEKTSTETEIRKSNYKYSQEQS